MSTTTAIQSDTNLSGLDTDRNSMYRWTVQYGAGSATHTNYRPSIGESEYSCHVWVQRKWKLAPQDYRITACHRVLRDPFSRMERGTVAMDEWASMYQPNPDCSKPVPAGDTGQDFPFVAELPKADKRRKGRAK